MMASLAPLAVPLRRGAVESSLNERGEIAAPLSLDDIAAAHERMESPGQRGRVVVLL